MRAIIIVTFAILVHGTKVDGTPIIKSCCDVANKDGSYFGTSFVRPRVYHIVDLCAQRPLIQGYCDTITDGGGWLVIQRRRQYGNEDFHRIWTDYERGFGSLYSEFWYGLKSLNCLTSRGLWELRIDFTFTNGTKSFMHYNHFRVGPATDKYRLSISGFTGITPDDPFTSWNINNVQFATRDRVDINNCAVNGHDSTAPGGWWHRNCFYINLNYNYGGRFGFIKLSGTWYTPKFIEMKIRPVNCRI